MADTTTRPSAWAVLYDELDPVSTSDLDRALDSLAEHGYRIVHPDDVPSNPWTIAEQAADSWQNGWLVGWNACRARVFRDA